MTNSNHQPKIDNPFLKEDWLAETLANQEKIQNKSLSELSKFRSNLQLKNQTSMSPKSYNILQFISKHVFLSLVIGLLTFTTISASAAQAFAPEEFKPTTIYNNLFKANKQIERDPYTKLQPDDNNYVLSLDKCDLSIKYPRQIANAPIYAANMDGLYNSSDKYISSLSLLTFELTKQTPPDIDYDDWVEFLTTYTTLHKLDMVCFEKGVNTYINLPDVPLDEKTLTTKDLMELTGWFITNEAQITNIRSVTFDDNVSLNFEYNNKVYAFNFKKEGFVLGPEADSRTKELESKGYYKKQGIFGNQVQIQFNSLVKSETNTVIDSLPNFSQPTNNSQPASSVSSNPMTSAGSAINLITPKRAGEFEKTYFGQQAPCGIPNLTTYAYPKSNQPGSSYMTIGNKQDYKGAEAQFYQQTEAFIKKLTQESPVQAFNDTCSGFASFFVQYIDGVELKGADSYVVYTAMEGQSELLDLRVRIVGKKGDQIFMMAKPVFENGYDEYLKACPASSNGDMTCFRNFAGNWETSLKSSETQLKARQAAQELAKTFDF